MLDLSGASLDVSGGACAINDGGVLLGDLDLMRLTQNAEVSILQLHAEIAGNDGAAGQDRDVLKHFLASVAEAGSLDAYAGEGAAQLVENDGGQSLALDVLGDYQQLAACLDDLLEQGQDLLNVGDLLIGDEDESVVNDGFHLVHISCHVGAEVAAVKLHAFDDIAVSFGGLGFLDGDDAVLADFLHRVCDQVADVLVAGGNGADAGDVIGAGNGLGDALDGLDSGCGGLLDALSHNHGVCARGEVLQTFVDHRLCEHGRAGGAVACDVVGLGGDFLDELCAHVLKRILKLDLLRDGHAVVGDQGSAELLVKHYVASLGAEGYFNGICKLVHAMLNSLACVFAVNYLFSHDI